MEVVEEGRVQVVFLSASEGKYVSSAEDANSRETPESSRNSRGGVLYPFVDLVSAVVSNGTESDFGETSESAGGINAETSTVEVILDSFKLSNGLIELLRV